VQQEKSGMQMNQLCTINITVQQQLLAVPNICAKACKSSGEDLFYFIYFFGDKTVNPGKFCLISHLQAYSRNAQPFFRGSVLSYTIHSARPIKGMHESCYCFAVVPKD